MRHVLAITVGIGAMALGAFLASTATGIPGAILYAIFGG